MPPWKTEGVVLRVARQGKTDGGRTRAGPAGRFRPSR